MIASESFSGLYGGDQRCEGHIGRKAFFIKPTMTPKAERSQGGQPRQGVTRSAGACSQSRGRDGRYEENKELPEFQPGAGFCPGRHRGRWCEWIGAGEGMNPPRTRERQGMRKQPSHVTRPFPQKQQKPLKL